MFIRVFCRYFILLVVLIMLYKGLEFMVIVKGINMKIIVESENKVYLRLL